MTPTSGEGGELELLRKCVRWVASNESGIWGVKAREVLDEIRKLEPANSYDEGFVTRRVPVTGIVTVCGACGAVVWDKEIHTEWHCSLETHTPKTGEDTDE